MRNAVNDGRRKENAEGRDKETRARRGTNEVKPKARRSASGVGSGERAVERGGGDESSDFADWTAVSRGTGGLAGW